jgi:hypothetical protein
MIKEITTYLKSYEDDNEDSDWDSDEEIAAISICKELKDAIEEKSNLAFQLSEVEKSLVAVNSNNSGGRMDSANESSDNSISKSPIIKKAASNNLQILSLKKEDSQKQKPTQTNVLYKNVLKKGSDSPVKNKPEREQSSSILLKNISDSISLDQDGEESLTPKSIKAVNSSNETRQHRRFNSDANFGQRSSSIQSMRSNKGTATSRRVKKKSTGSGKLKIIKPKKQRKHSNSSESLNS